MSNTLTINTLILTWFDLSEIKPENKSQAEEIKARVKIFCKQKKYAALTKYLTDKSVAIDEIFGCHTTEYAIQAIP